MTEVLPCPAASKTYSVLVAEPERSTRDMLAAVLGAAPRLDVVDEAADADEAVVRAARIRPDVVVLGAGTSGTSVATATRRLRAAADPPEIVVLTEPDDHERGREALRAGASCLLPRNSPPERLACAIPAVAAGYVVMAPDVVGQLMEGAAGRDLHDVLGRTLAAINRKGELVARLLVAQPERARAELETVLALARRSVAEVRALAAGYRLGDLATELEQVRADLEVMGVRVETARVPPALPRPIQEAFGWVAREAAANVIRHSEAGHCRIEIWTGGRTAHLRITNDGVHRPGPTAAGTGLAGLAARLRVVGGALVHGPGPDLTYRVEATAPLGG
ncbi:response regulator receiver domain-containing protein [Actinomadura pelletieri DSM 43383]|uniref:Response regulator receiver domain-containing protein n=1 Tax=Actinomadura pelletieri DSM 43383 TaxID=1120940 RepID=A0A495QKK9_9ACTN|nr:histidine kinase [Actinomadura pelletieri]RKS73127.1 response regulator receiver domain-containing protein [Actinomadura pelletieri DSM 43383]